MLPAAAATELPSSSLAPQPAQPSTRPPNSNNRSRARRSRRGGGAPSRPANGQDAVTPPDDNGGNYASRRRGVRDQSGQEHVHHNRRRGVGSAVSTHNQTRLANTRQFGGSLTTHQDSAASATSPLQADALEFVPGAQNFADPSSHAATGGSQPSESTPRTSKSNSVPHRPRRRLSKSTAPDIASRVHEDIDNAQYECPICTSEIVRKSKVWSCHQCWTVFHLDCIKKWSNRKPDGQSTAEDGSDSQTWRCPGCNLPQTTKPKVYQCWCGKETEPRPISGLPPHSCGQTCGKARESPKRCPHPCELVCHAGPCPPCQHMGPVQRCFCGKQSVKKRCSETDYEKGWSCGQPCADIMPCGEHSCPRECHSGLCGVCEVRINARCYCGKEEKTILCCDKSDEETSQRTHLGEDGTELTEEWTGLFQCNNICERFFDCQKHQCLKPCHATNGGSTKCPRSPELITHCPCGKTALSQISSNPRLTCEDPIPYCSKICMKELSCGHFCQQTCHTGACMPCLQTVSIRCRCGRTSTSTVCHQGTEEPPLCKRICKTILNCGRHECGEHCCSGEKKASERAASKRKQRPLDSFQRLDDSFEAEHICTRVCGKLLKCGNHTCNELCHKGPCGSCREAIFEEISCNCGRTILQPPLPCGTQVPVCRFDCERPTSCGHPRVQHNCHSDSEACPKCPYLVEKDCMCGKKTLKNQKCWFIDVRCGEICGKRLKCGSHACRKTCHKPGECEDQTGSYTCQQTCGKLKSSCGHTCEEPCHAPYPCREEKACQHKTFITCDCQNIKSEVRCAATKTNPGNSTKTLPCTDECARLERNRKLAMALNIDPATHTDDHIPYSTETLNLFNSPNLDQNWLLETEREFRLFAADESEKRKRFKPMPALQRSFLHSLSEDFGFDSESMDPEPHRHVAMFKTPRFVSAPNKTLRDCVRIQRNKAAEAATEAQIRFQEKQAEREKSQVTNIREPYNGFLLQDPRFALTIDELKTELAVIVGLENPRVNFNIQFLPSGDVALKASPGNHTERTIDGLMKEIKVPLARSLESQKMGYLKLARFDESLNTVHKEGDAAGEGGWSKVAAKAAAPSRLIAHPSLHAEPRSKNGFMVLGNLASKKTMDDRSSGEAEKPKKKKQEFVVEDWEAAENEAEEKEKVDAVAAVAADGNTDGATTASS